ncbi:MAG: hypothetical protein ACTHKH_04945 [Trinickia sp.]|jgi:hypothetical protein
MTSLKIENLDLAKDLDSRAMSAVRGGMLGCFPLVPYVPVNTTDTTNFNAQQLIGQTNSIVSNNGNNVAFASGITSTFKPSQTATNTINF